MCIRDRGNISFRTTPSGSNLERLHIRSDGAIFLTHPNVNINRGTSGAGYPLTVRGPSSGDVIRLERANSGQWHFGFDGNTNFTVKSNTSEVVRITTNGDVGIGYNSPTVRLHVREAASGASSYDNRYHIIVEDDAEGYLGFYVPNSGYAGIRFADTTGTEGYIDYYFANDEMHYASTLKHIFKTGNVERFRINSDGNAQLANNLSLIHI